MLFSVSQSYPRVDSKSFEIAKSPGGLRHTEAPTALRVYCAVLELTFSRLPGEVNSKRDEHSVVVIGKESTGKSQLVASLTGGSARASNFSGATVACETY